MHAPNSNQSVILSKLADFYEQELAHYGAFYDEDDTRDLIREMRNPEGGVCSAWTIVSGFSHYFSERIKKRSARRGQAIDLSIVDDGEKLDDTIDVILTTDARLQRPPEKSRYTGGVEVIEKVEDIPAEGDYLHISYDKKFNQVMYQGRIGSRKWSSALDSFRAPDINEELIALLQGDETLAEWLQKADNRHKLLSFIEHQQDINAVTYLAQRLEYMQNSHKYLRYADEAVEREYHPNRSGSIKSLHIDDVYSFSYQGKTEGIMCEYQLADQLMGKELEQILGQVVNDGRLIRVANPVHVLYIYQENGKYYYANSNDNHRQKPIEVESIDALREKILEGLWLDGEQYSPINIQVYHLRDDELIDVRAQYQKADALLESFAEKRANLRKKVPLVEAGYADNWNALHMAATSGDTQSIARYCKYFRDTEGQVVDIDAQIKADEGDDTPVMLAASQGELDAMDMLLENGADSFKCNFMGQNAWSEAITNLDERMFARLVAKRGDELNKPFPDGFNLLHKAVKKRNMKQIELLKAFDVDLLKRTVDGESILDHLLHTESYDFFQKMLEMIRIAHPDLELNTFLIPDKHDVNNIFLSVVAAGNQLLVRYFLERRLQDRLNGDEKHYVVNAAVENGDVALLNILLDNGFSLTVPNPDEECYTALKLAVMLGKLDMAVAILGKEISPNYLNQKAYLGNTVLHDLADGKCPNIVEAILERGGDVTSRGFQDFTPIHNAAVIDNLNFVTKCASINPKQTLKALSMVTTGRRL